MRSKKFMAILACAALLAADCAAGFVSAASLAKTRHGPADPGAAFVQGYRYYGNHDLASAMKPLRLAARHHWALADYALFYLGSAERDAGRADAAAATFKHLAETYPQSVFAEPAGLELARLKLKLGDAAEAKAVAMRLAAHTADSGIEQNARIVIARSMIAMGDLRAAYAELEGIRNKFPRGPADPQARALAYSIVSANPRIVHSTSPGYRRAEAELLLREGEPAMALAQAKKALALSPSFALRAELLWIEAEALRANPDEAKKALYKYLAAAPHGAEAPAALNALAHVYWRVKDTARAREMFARIIRDFPASRLASDAILETGRTFEDDGNFGLARSEYRWLLSRYPSSEAAAEARFRAPFMLYMMRHYAEAARRFSARGALVQVPPDRDMFSYWEARSLQKNGDEARARAIFKRLAESTDSNYYPALASRIVRAEPDAFAPALAPDPPAGIVPKVSSPAASFHLRRVLALKELHLKALIPPELSVLEDHADGNPQLSDFLLAEFMASGAYYDAITAAARMARRGSVDPALAERVRYPRAYWGLIASVAHRNGIDPYLVLAVTRQESLFDPDARSVSDARGLMQLLPSTAHRVVTPSRTGVPKLDLYDPALNVRLGVTYLKGLLRMFDGDPVKAVAAYNAGEHAVAGWLAKFPGDDDQWVENIGYGETRDYVKKVIGGLREYRLLYQRSASSPSNRTSQSPG
jgi:peptidoglycan lytic transglycosylase